MVGQTGDRNRRRVGIERGQVSTSVGAAQLKCGAHSVSHLPTLLHKMPARNLSTCLRHRSAEFAEQPPRVLSGRLIHVSVGSVGGRGGCRTKRFRVGGVGGIEYAGALLAGDFGGAVAERKEHGVVARIRLPHREIRHNVADVGPSNPTTVDAQRVGRLIDHPEAGGFPRKALAPPSGAASQLEDVTQLRLRVFSKSDRAPVIGDSLISKMPDAGDRHGAMTLPFRPVNSCLLCLASVELAVSRVFDDVVGDRGMRIAALGARFDVNRGHLFYSLRVRVTAPRGLL